MYKKTVILLFAPLLLIGQENVRFAETITEKDLEKHLMVLASDSLEGRETGKSGQKMAADYIMNYFKSIGIPPYKRKKYYQKFKMRDDRSSRILKKKVVVKGENENEKADEGDHRGHHAGEGIEHEPEVDGGGANGEPFDVESFVIRGRHSPRLVARHQREHARAEQGRHSDTRRAAATLHAARDGGSHQRQQRNQCQCFGTHSSFKVSSCSRSTVLKWR